MKLSLVVLAAGSMQGKALDIKLSQFLVGRDPQCHLRPSSPLISKRHCAVIQREGKVFIRDFGSTNGTFVNDEPVKGEVELHHDDRLKIGPLLFSVKIEATAPVNQPTPLPPTKVPATTKTAPATPGTDANLPAAKKAAAAPSGKLPAKAATPAKTGKPAEKEAAVAPAAAEEEKASPAATEAAAAAASGSDGPAGDDDIAAMLLSLQDDDGPSTAGLSSDPVPDGSTVMDLVVPPPGSDPNATTKLEKDKAKPNPNAGNTSSAAKSILEKYMRRPRNNG